MPFSRIIPDIQLEIYCWFTLRKNTYLDSDKRRNKNPFILSNIVVKSDIFLQRKVISQFP
jgi:hypothetical protein